MPRSHSCSLLTPSAPAADEPVLEPALGVQAQLQDEGEARPGMRKAQVPPLHKLFAALGLCLAEQGKPGELQEAGQDGLSLGRIDRAAAGAGFQVWMVRWPGAW